MISAILFDAYGTLIDTKNGSILATEAILRKNSKSLDAAEVYSKWKEYHRMHIDALTAFVKEEEIFLRGLRQLYQEYAIGGDPEKDVKIMLSTLGVRQVFPETIEVVDRLRQRYRVYMASTSDHDPLMSDLERNSLVVDGCFTSELLGVYKPRPEFYLQILERTGLKPENALFVGDSPIDDILGPHSVGIRTVWVNRNNRHLPAGIPTPDHQITDLRELLSIL